ncbi:MAG: uridine kinase [Micromonosporaceae bacterium]|nr:uridine kinase [Micromonosporaceae bacterium]
MTRQQRARVRPISPSALVEELADRITATRPGHWLRVAVDGAPAAAPDALAAGLVDPLRVRGRPAQLVPAAGFLRPASVRLELGRQDPDSYYQRWLDEPGLRREVLDPLGPGGTGRVLPSLWDPVTDRATRAGYLSVPPGGVVLVSGALLLGGALPFDLTVHLALSPAALSRRTSPEQRWTLPAFDRYRREVAPEQVAGIVIRTDDPDHPAIVDRR